MALNATTLTGLIQTDLETYFNDEGIASFSISDHALAMAEAISNNVIDHILNNMEVDPDTGDVS